MVRFPSTFVPTEMRVMDTGRRLAAYGPAVQDIVLSDVPPSVVLVDVVTARIITEMQLHGVKAGQIAVETSEKDGPCCHIYTPGLAWDLKGQQLYVVHADQEEVTVVDLAAGKILRHRDIRPRRSLLEWAWDWLVPVVEAKGVPATRKDAVLSVDESRLYVLGLRGETSKGPDGLWRTNQVPLGLQVLSTDDLSQLHRFDLPVSEFGLSPDGKRFLLTGRFGEYSETGRMAN